MGDGTKENPYTREDVLRLIEENGGKAEGLNLSRKVFGKYIDLSKLDLKGIAFSDANTKLSFTETGLVETDLSNANLEETNLTDAALHGADLRRANLRSTNLQRATLWNANLQETDLIETDLQGADLRYANLQGALLYKVNLQEANLARVNLQMANIFKSKLQLASFHWALLSKVRLIGSVISYETKLDDVDWGPTFILQEEEEGYFEGAEEVYRNLKQWHTQHGLYDIAGKFFFREMTVKRKSMEWWPKPWHRAFSKLLSILCGYGEKPERVVISAAVVVLGLTFIYFLTGLVWQWGAFWSSLYFSAVSFTALGYGSWVGTTSDFIRGLGAAESFMGVFMMALFLVTFIRKMTR